MIPTPSPGHSQAKKLMKTEVQKKIPVKTPSLTTEALPREVHTFPDEMSRKGHLGKFELELVIFWCFRSVA